MKKATIRPMATQHRSFRLSRPDRATVEKRFTLPVSRPVTLAKSESWGRNPARHQGRRLYAHAGAWQQAKGRADGGPYLLQTLPCHPGTGSGPPHPCRYPGPAGWDTDGAGSGQGHTLEGT